MKLTLRILFFVALVAIAAIALLLLLPGLKEGVSQEELPALIGGVGLFLLLAFLWWFMSGRSLRRSVLGWMVLALPTAAYLAQAGQLIAANVEGLHLARSVSIEAYQETPIEWPGFDGPVGLTISFDLVHPEDVSALILPPEIRMGPELEIPRDKLNVTQTNGSGYFKDSYVDQPVGDLALLKSVLFQRLYENDSFDRDYEKWISAFPFAPGARTHLTFHLHPGHDRLFGKLRASLSFKPILWTSRVRCGGGSQRRLRLAQLAAGDRTDLCPGQRSDRALDRRRGQRHGRGPGPGAHRDAARRE
jgi:hypothetical protein